MDGIFRLLERFFSKTSKLLAIRLELKMQQGTDNNQPISRFCRQFKSTLIQHYGPAITVTSGSERKPNPQPNTTIWLCCWTDKRSSTLTMSIG